MRLWYATRAHDRLYRALIEYDIMGLKALYGAHLDCFTYFKFVSVYGPYWNESPAISRIVKDDGLF